MEPDERNFAAAKAAELLETAGFSLRLSLRDFAVLVKSDKREPLAWLRWFLAPCFATSRTESGDWRITYRADAGHFAALARELSEYDSREIPSRVPGGRQVCHREYFVPGMRVLHNDEFGAFCFAWPERRELLLLAERDDEESRLYLARATRKLTTLHYERQGAAVAHACAFVRDGFATLGVAEKGGGKTTFLIRDLLAGADLISNDRVLLYREGGQVMVAGLPNIVTIRPGTLDLFPEMRDQFLRQHYQPLALRDKGDELYRITVAQLCHLTGARPAASAPVGRIVFLAADGDGGEAPSATRAAQLLKAALFDYGDRPRVFFSSLYPVEPGEFRQAADLLCDFLVNHCSCEYGNWRSAGVAEARPPSATRSARRSRIISRRQ